MLQSVVDFAASVLTWPPATDAEQARVGVYAMSALVGITVSSLITLAKSARRRRALARAAA